MQLHLDGEGDGVEVLSLYRSGIDDVPASVWELRSLESLNLSCNRLRSLPPGPPCLPSAAHAESRIR